MAILQDGITPGTLAGIDALQRSLRINIRPPEGLLGAYRAAFVTTSLAFTNGVNIASFVNPTTNLMVVSRFKANLKPMAITASTLTGLECRLSAFVGRGWSTIGTTGRTAMSLAGSFNKMRSSFATSGANMGFANVVGGITGDAGITQDGNPFAVNSLTPQTHAVTATATPGTGVQDDTMGVPIDFQPDLSNLEYPLVLVQNEGIRLVYNVTTAAAHIIYGEIAWTEWAPANFA